MPKFRMKVWEDFTATRTWKVTVEADTQEEAEKKAKEAAENREGCAIPYSDDDITAQSFEVNENSIEVLDDK